MSTLAPAAECAVMIIECLSDADTALGISEISRRLEINKNMVFRALTTLEERGWVYCDTEKRYFLTLRPFELCSRASGRLNINSVGAPLVHELWKKTGESTYLAIPSGDQVLYLQHFDSTRNVRVAGRIGGLYDFCTTAPGKAILAFSDESVANMHVLKTKAYKSALSSELKEIRECGYATDNEAFSKGIICIAAPVLGYGGEALGAVGCSVSTVDFTLESAKAALCESVLDTAASISEILGYRK
jgi:DNA-binding IclR family transcriptional regulator